MDYNFKDLVFTVPIIPPLHLLKNNHHHLLQRKAVVVANLLVLANSADQKILKYRKFLL